MLCFATWVTGTSLWIGMGVMMEDKEIIMYTCYTCNINFPSRRCPRCGENGTRIYKENLGERPNNNPTDVNDFFNRKQKG